MSHNLYYKITIHYISNREEILFIPADCLRYFSEFLLGENIRDFYIEEFDAINNYEFEGDENNNDIDLH